MDLRLSANGVCWWMEFALCSKLIMAGALDGRLSLECRYLELKCYFESNVFFYLFIFWFYCVYRRALRNFEMSVGVFFCCGLIFEKFEC